MSKGYVIGSPEKARRLGHRLAAARVRAAHYLGGGGGLGVP
jgi:hypothetical protein